MSMSVICTTMTTRTKGRVMTEAPSAASEDSITPKATKDRGSTRSHGTTGNDKTRERLEREAAARRAVFAVSLAGFVTVFGLIASAGKPAPAVSTEQPVLVSDLTPANRVVAEVPVTGLNSDTTQTIIRIVAPEPRASAPHVRTRAS
jgi:hypothetical protein